jgi:hypothetical protein
LHYHWNRTILLQMLVCQSFLVLLSGRLASGPSHCISDTSNPSSRSSKSPQDEEICRQVSFCV